MSYAAVTVIKLHDSSLLTNNSGQRDTSYSKRYA